jgi:PAS domain S-box-containing protein
MYSDSDMFRSLFQYATEGIIISDQKGNIRLVNPSAEKIFGYESGELNGLKIETLIPARYHRQHEKHRTGYHSKPSSREMGHGRDLYGMRKDNSEIMVEISLSPFSTDEGNFVMCFVVDITHRKKSETELRLAHEQLKQTSDALSRLNLELESKVKLRTSDLAEAVSKLNASQRELIRALEKEKELNELKSRFVTTASHEFRTPLGTILSSASLIARYESVDDSDKRKKHIERIKSAVGNLTEILNDFLSLEKLEEGVLHSNPERIQLQAFIDDLIDELKVIAKKDQQLVADYAASEWHYIDARILKNILINLVSNAIKYTPEGKKITIAVSEEKANLVIRVMDEGIGIPEQDQKHIFERFFRAGNAGNEQGTGLGLHIVRKYAELLQAKITFNSEYGKGSVFQITIPKQ